RYSTESRRPAQAEAVNMKNLFFGRVTVELGSSGAFGPALCGEVLYAVESVYRLGCSAFRLSHAFMSYRRGFVLLQSFQILSELTVPGRNYNRNSALRLRLAGKTNQRFGLSGVNVAELFDLFSFTGAHVR